MTKVLSLHTFELKPGCDATQFEEFVLRDILPVYRKVPGQTAQLIKGDRGERTGKYLLLVELQSVERRDDIYPPEGADRSIAHDVHEFLQEIGPLWDTFFTFAEISSGLEFTDYVMLSD